ncbi:LysR family transcriptional regulator [Rouxiella badensis]|uniref:LysR family transcriptional regulator n=1 Tax=Rouxiella badensis TaxID=1646377 RepID=UPI001D133199|nr:LysR family transcriptional regulator [Rouxiella badensis]MCC3718448.1 LysR family transcriptional regulator [Rouxiella badensis]MCC3726784.1 LysR family transcriptional regulator [Rouxiella badensis]MCC3738867.1 LysR family transcriptional regulator [Rouxiella badensis]WAT09896.1 LysR family transcriptional regulator [Rouxiella badensis]
MHSALRRLDLNLLLAFDAVYRHQSVTLAADELAMSTSALSHALTRLRSTLNDPLFFREGNQMRASLYANQLAEPVAESLRLLNFHLMPKPDFNPLTSNVCFKVAITDYTAFCVFPELMAELQKRAPGVKFELLYSPQMLAINELLAGHLDFALGFSEPDENIHDEIQAIDWLEDQYVAIRRKEFATLTTEEYLKAHHVVVTPWNEARGVIDFQLEKMGLHRHVTLKTPSMLSAPFIVAQSDLLMTLPRFAAEKFCRLVDVNAFPLPFYVPNYQVKIYSHRFSGKSAANQWLQTILRGLSLPSPGH